jgi:hypothetical protein
VDAKHTAQVDHVEHIQTQIAKIVMNRRSQVFARESWNPGSILSAPGAELGDDHQIVGIAR